MGCQYLQNRGAGASIASHYSKLAKRIQHNLPKSLHNLAQLDMDKEEGVKGNELSLNLTAHGAGRKMSRNADKNLINFNFKKRRQVWGF